MGFRYEPANTNRGLILRVTKLDDLRDLLLDLLAPLKVSRRRVGWITGEYKQPFDGPALHILGQVLNSTAFDLGSAQHLNSRTKCVQRAVDGMGEGLNCSRIAVTQ